MLEIRNSDSLHFEQDRPNPSARLVTGTNGARCGICRYTATIYQQPGVHDDQEGFYVLEGNGWLLADKVEYPVRTGDALVLPAGTAHSFRRDAACEALVVLYFHAAE